MAEGPEEQFTELVSGLAVAYSLLMQTCALLPIPHRLPMVHPELEIDDMRLAVSHAAHAVGDLPLDDIAGSVLTQALIEWIAAGMLIEVYSALQDGPSLLAAEFMVRTCVTGSRLALQLLTEQQ
jgi:hypothetical protein